jgi:hypothetical protein
MGWDFERMNLFEKKRSSGPEFNGDVAKIVSPRAVAKEY